jgi:NADPH-dependent glutamate synthase beta subunit-like oxidoreductase
MPSRGDGLVRIQQFRQSGKEHDHDLPILQGISDDHRDLSQIEAFLRERGIDYVTYQDWKILDQYEVACGARQGRPRVKVTTVPEMMAIIHQGRITGK